MSTHENEVRQAVGLHYARDSESAPKVIAAGSGTFADRILAVAEAHGVPICSDPDLLELLNVTNVGDEIPVEVYGAVASLLTFLYRLNAELGGETAPV